jgi:hypothetical protein
MSTLHVLLVTSASKVNSTTDRHISIMTAMSSNQDGTPFRIDPVLLAFDHALLAGHDTDVPSRRPRNYFPSSTYPPLNEPLAWEHLTPLPASEALA